MLGKASGFVSFRLHVGDIWMCVSYKPVKGSLYLQKSKTRTMSLSKQIMQYRQINNYMQILQKICLKFTIRFLLLIGNLYTATILSLPSLTNVTPFTV